MNTKEAIMTRTSVRKYTDKKISDEDLKTILRAGMSGPSAVNKRDWSFIVVRDKDILNKMAAGNGFAAEPLKNADVGILVLGDKTRAFKQAPDYWIIDGAIAAQNMILAAHELGIGSCWLGTWPQESKITAQTELFNIPDTHIPHSIIAFGYPAEDPPVKAPEWEADRVHYDRW